MDFVELWKLVQAGGPAVILLLLGALYWLNGRLNTEIAKNEKLQAQKDALNDRTLNIANDAAGAIRDFREMLNFRGAEKSK